MTAGQRPHVLDQLELRINKLLQVVEELVRANYRLKKELAQWEKKGTNKQAEEKLTQLNRELEQLKRENRVLREREKLIQNKLERLEVKLDKINL